MAVAATVTERIQLATGIAIGLTRSPFETAMAALDLDHISQERFVLGLGTGPIHWTKRERPESLLKHWLVNATDDGLFSENSTEMSAIFDVKLDALLARPSACG